MIKVLQFIHGLSMGGAETLVKDYALGIRSDKFELSVLCYQRLHTPYEQLLKEAGISVIYLSDYMPLSDKKEAWARIINRIMRYMLVRKAIRKLEPDIIHAHLEVNSYLKYARPKKKTVIFYTQHFQVKRWRSKDIKALQWMMCRYYVQIIALSADMKKEIDEIFHINHTVVLNNGINIERFSGKASKKTVREKLKIPQEAFVVGHAGRFSKVKNHDFLVDIFAEITKKKENAFLLMIGSGDTKEAVQKKLQGLGLGNRVMILSNRTDMPELMRAMDVFVFPSLMEGLGIVLIEAQISGLRCLVSDAVPKVAEISNLIRYKSLSETAREWADEILGWEEGEAKYFAQDKWDMSQIIRDLERMYIDAVSDIL